MRKWIAVILSLALVMTGIAPVYAQAGFMLDLDQAGGEFSIGDEVQLSGRVRSYQYSNVGVDITALMYDAADKYAGQQSIKTDTDGYFSGTLTIGPDVTPGNCKIVLSIDNKDIETYLFNVDAKDINDDGTVTIPDEIVNVDQKRFPFTYQSEHDRTSVVVVVYSPSDRPVYQNSFLTDENGYLEGYVAIGDDWEPGTYVIEITDDKQVSKIDFEISQYNRIVLKPVRKWIYEGKTSKIKVGAVTTDGKTIGKIPLDGITFKSSQPNTANIDENGKITAFETGKTTITATLGTLKDSFVLVVKKKENNGGSNNGGGSSNPPIDIPRQPSQPTNEDTQTPEEEETPKVVEPKRPIDVDDEYTSENRERAKELAKGLDKKAAKQAKKEVADLAKAIGKELREEGLNAHEAKQIAREMVKTAKVLLEKDDLTVAEAAEVVETILEENIAETVAKDEQKANMLAMKKDVEALSQKLIRKAGKVNAAADVKKENEQVIISYPADAVEAAITQMKGIQKQLTKKLSETGLETVATVRPELVMELPEVDGNDQLAISLQDDVIASLQEAGADILIAGNGFQFGLPSDVIGQHAAANALTVVAKPVSLSEQPAATAPKTTANESLKLAGGMFDLDVLYSDAEGKEEKVAQFAKKPSIAFTLPADMTDTNRLGIYVLIEETSQWEQIRSKIADGQITCEAPHFSLYAVMEKDVQIADIQQHWAKETIEKLLAQGVVPMDMITGDQAQNILPNQKITRAEFAALLVNMLEIEGDVAGNFNDIAEDAWYYDAVALAASSGLVRGVGNGNFAPDAEITRQDLCVMIGRAYELAYGMDMTGSTVAFNDEESIRDYAAAAVNAARYQQIVNGYSDGSFKPFNNATRAEAIKMVLSLMEQ